MSDAKHSAAATPSKPSAAKKAKKHNNKDIDSNDAAAAHRRSERKDRDYGDSAPLGDRYNALYARLDKMPSGERRKGHSKARQEFNHTRKTYKALSFIEERGSGIPASVATRAFRKAQIEYNDRYGALPDDKKFMLSKKAAGFINAQIFNVITQVMAAVEPFLRLEKRVQLDARHVKEAAIVVNVVPRNYMLGFGDELKHIPVDRKLIDDKYTRKAFNSVEKHKAEERKAQRVADEEAASTDA